MPRWDTNIDNCLVSVLVQFWLKSLMARWDTNIDNCLVTVLVQFWLKSLMARWDTNIDNCLVPVHVQFWLKSIMARNDTNIDNCLVTVLVQFWLKSYVPSICWFQPVFPVGCRSLFYLLTHPYNDVQQSCDLSGLLIPSVCCLTNSDTKTKIGWIT